MRSRAISVLLITSVAVGCSESTDPDPAPPVYVVRVNLPAIDFNTIGDSVQVLASVTNPDPRFPPSFSWTSRDTSVARVSPAGMVLARRNGTTVIVVAERGGGRDSTRVVVAHRSGLRLSPAALTLVTIGDTAQATASQGRPVPGQAPDFFWTIRDTTVARVTQTGTVRALKDGTTLLLVRDQVGERDSVRVDVSPQVTQVRLTPDDVIVGLTRSVRFGASFLDAGGRPLTSGTRSVRWSSTRGVPADSVSISSGQSVAWFQPGALGRDTVRVTVDGATATAPIEVRPRVTLEVLPSTGDTVFTAVEGVSMQPSFVQVTYSTPDDAVTLQFAIEDTTVARISRSSVGQTGGVQLPALLGVKIGRTVMIVSAPGATTLRVPVVVSPLELRPQAKVLFPVAGRFAGMTYTFRETARGQPVEAQRVFTFDMYSTDSTAVLMTPLIGVTSTPGRSTVGSGFLTGEPGRTAYIVFRLAGQPAESTLVKISSGSMTYIQFSLINDPIRHVRAFAGTNHLVYYTPDRYPAQPATIRFSHTNPSLTTWPDTLYVPTNLLQATRNIRFDALRVGVDTIVAGGTGMRGDTLIVTVDSARMGPDFPVNPLISGTRSRIPVNLRGRIFTAFSPTPIPVTVTSSDPTILRGPAAAVPIMADGGRPFGSGDLVDVFPLKPGRARLTFSSTQPGVGVFTTSPIEVMPNHITVVDGPTPNFGRPVPDRIVVGMRQSEPGAGGFGVQLTASPANDTVQLRSSDTSLVKLTRPALSIFMNGSQAFSIIGGNRSGSAWVVAIAPGLIPDSMQVVVSRPRLGVELGRISPDSLTRWRLRVVSKDPSGASAVPAPDTIPVRIESSDTTVATVSVSEAIIHAGELTSSEVRVRFKNVPLSGQPLPQVFIRVHDTRSVPYRYESAVIELDYNVLLSASGRAVTPISPP